MAFIVVINSLLTFLVAVSPPAYPLGSVPPPQQQYIYDPSSSQQQQQQLYYQQQFVYGYALAPNADEIPPGVNAPPAFPEVDLIGSAY